MKILKKVLIAVLSLIIVVLVAFGGFVLLYTPTLVFDASSLTGNVTTGATGFLYGIAEEGVPSSDMIESINLSSLSTKTEGGLQHPIGEVGDVASTAMASDSCEYLIVYLQDMYDTWYYDHQNIVEMKKAGTYDWREYIETTFFPMVEETISLIKQADYHDKIVYCLYNEVDNAIWFGNWVVDENNGDGGYNQFEEEGRSNFYEAWKLTYDYVKSLDADALIGGPGNYEYNSGKMDGFLAYTSANNCTPDVMIYHELQERSIYDWQVHVADLRNIEEKYSISVDTPIIVTEYGTMEQNGNPNTMAKYITQIEYSKVYGNQAYWLLANNLCNTAADYNTPNSAWWVFRWYADMQGQTMKQTIHDLFHSDLGKAYKEKRELRYQQFMGVASLNDDKNAVDVVVAGADYNGTVKLKNLGDTDLKGKQVTVTVSAVTYQGLQGQVYAPEIVKSYTTKCGNNLKIDMSGMNSNTAYHIEVREESVKQEDYKNDNLYTRYEFEQGTLLGNAYTYDSAYATTGDLNGMVGGMENEGDGVQITVDVDEDAMYEIKVIFGNSNDGATSDDRVDTEAVMTVDTMVCMAYFENTVKSELTSAYTFNMELSKGSHTISFKHSKGTYVLDSLLIKKAEEGSQICALKDSNRTTENLASFLVVAPTDDYYDINALPVYESSALPDDFASDIDFDNLDIEMNVDGAIVKADENGIATAFLKRGLNYISLNFNHKYCDLSVAYTEKEISNVIMILPEDAKLSGSAKIINGENHTYIDSITSDSGCATYKVNAYAGGTYKMTVRYANNDENGVHDYNVDLIEDYITVDVNGSKQNVYCRNTLSWDTYTTVTFNIELKNGENVIMLYNDGSNLFNGNTAKAPHISDIVLSCASA